MEIALKECYETVYWLEILYRIKSISIETFEELSKECNRIRRQLDSSIKTVKEKSNALDIELTAER